MRDRERRSHVLAVRVPPSMYEAVHRLAPTPAQRAAWLRDAITHALRDPVKKRAAERG